MFLQFCQSGRDRSTHKDSSVIGTDSLSSCWSTGCRVELRVAWADRTGQLLTGSLNGPINHRPTTEGAAGKVNYSICPCTDCMHIAAKYHLQLLSSPNQRRYAKAIFGTLSVLPAAAGHFPHRLNFTPKWELTSSEAIENVFV
jgi:hypothetical protein